MANIAPFTFNAPFQTASPVLTGQQMPPGVPPMGNMPMQGSMYPQMPQSTLTGRYVASADEIMPQEVSMSAVPSLFPLADGSAIIAKKWANDGKIETVRYTADVQDDKALEDAPGISLVDIMETLDDMQDVLESIKKSTAKPPASKRSASAKKEAENAEND